MPRLLLVIKYLVLSFMLLLTFSVNLKAEESVCTFVCNSDSYEDQLDPFKEKQPSFYPNPVRDVVNLTNQENVIRIRVISLTGKTLIDIKTTKKNINLSHLHKGMYLINFDMKDGKRVARKLVKK